MKFSASPLAASVVAFVLLSRPVAAQETVLVIGDSLSREYQFEFPEFSEARNWVELLAVHRPDDFYFGPLETTDLSLIADACDFFSLDNPICDALDEEGELDRYRYNWAIPTSSAEDYANELTGGSVVQNLLQDLINDDFDDVDSVVVFLGGNDIDRVYSSVYNGNTSTTNDVIEDIKDDLDDVIDFVLDDTPNMRMILVNVPHVGATPEVKAAHPTDPVKTQRVTDALRTLDTDLRTLADNKGIGYADILTVTIDLLPSDPFCLGGFPFINDGDDDGEPEYMWLGGDLSQNFHPNTAGQALLANEIIRAYNEKYGLGVEPFSEIEIVEDLVGLETPFGTWAVDQNLPEGQDGPDDDPDGDGLNNLIEFVLATDPLKHTALPAPTISGGNFIFEIPLGDTECDHITITPQTSTDLSDWQDAPPGAVTITPGESLRVTLPATEGAQFVRLEFEAG